MFSLHFLLSQEYTHYTHSASGSLSMFSLHVLLSQEYTRYTHSASGSLSRSSLRVLLRQFPCRSGKYTRSPARRHKCLMQAALLEATQCKLPLNYSFTHGERYLQVKLYIYIFLNLNVSLACDLMHCVFPLYPVAYCSVVTQTGCCFCRCCWRCLSSRRCVFLLLFAMWTGQRNACPSLVLTRLWVQILRWSTDCRQRCVGGTELVSLLCRFKGPGVCVMRTR